MALLYNKNIRDYHMDDHCSDTVICPPQAHRRQDKHSQQMPCRMGTPAIPTQVQGRQAQWSCNPPIPSGLTIKVRSLDTGNDDLRVHNIHSADYVRRHELNAKPSQDSAEEGPASCPILCSQHPSQEKVYTGTSLVVTLCPLRRWSQARS